MAEWISVKDRLPESKEVVFVFDSISKICTVGHYVKHEWGGCWMAFYGVGSVCYNISHWMPLPKPPKGE